MNNVDINLVFFEITSVKDLSNMQKYMLDNQIKINDHEDGIYRVVTHQGISYQDIDRLIECLISYLK